MSKLGDQLIESMGQALAHRRDKQGDTRTHKVAVRLSETRKAPECLGLSQDQFAVAFGVSPSTLKKWEQGQRSPTGAARTLLKIIEREAGAVVRALRTA